MPRLCVCLIVVNLVGSVMSPQAVGQNTDRPINMVVTGQVAPPVMHVGEPIPLAVTVSNGLSVPVFHSTFALKPNDWNGETYNVSLVDIYRDGKESNLHLARPKMNVPHLVAGIGGTRIEPGKSLQIETDARKWKLRDGWLPGRYEVTVRVDGLRIDPYYRLSVLSDPFEFEIRDGTASAKAEPSEQDSRPNHRAPPVPSVEEESANGLTEAERNVVFNYHASPAMLEHAARICLRRQLTKAEVLRGTSYRMRREVKDDSITFYFAPSQWWTLTFDDRGKAVAAEITGRKITRKDVMSASGSPDAEAPPTEPTTQHEPAAEAVSRPPLTPQHTAPLGPPDGDRILVPVNTQKTLVEAVGTQFRDEDWEYPSDLLPDTFPGLEHVSGPGESGVSGKGDWRKPVTLKHGPSGTEVFVNCYRRRKEPAEPRDPNVPGTPFVPLTEPDYQYQSAEFHALKAAAARDKTRDVFVFFDGDVLFKVEASGGNPEQRLKLVRSTAEAIWKFRHREDAATIRGFFRPTKEEFFADEPITVEMVVHNDGPEDFRFDKGGDYRLGNGRQDRFSVTFKDSNAKYTSCGGGAIGLGVVPARGVYKEVIDLTPWGPPAPDENGILRVTCRRTLTTQVATKLLIGCLETQPIDYTRKDARAVLIAEVTRSNQRRAGFADEHEKQKEIERVVDLYMRFPQIQSTVECKVNGRVRGTSGSDLDCP